MRIVSNGDNLHEMLNAVFFGGGGGGGGGKKKNINLSSFEFAHNVVKV